MPRAVHCAVIIQYCDGAMKGKQEKTQVFYWILFHKKHPIAVVSLLLFFFSTNLYNYSPTGSFKVPYIESKLEESIPSQEDYLSLGPQRGQIRLLLSLIHI